MTEQTSLAGTKGRLFVPAMIAVNAAAPTVFVGFPAIVGQVMRQWRFGESAVGISAFIEILGITLGTLAAALLLSRKPVRNTLAVAALLAVAANLLTPASATFGAYCLLRFVAGVGAGALGGIAMRYLSYAVAPAKRVALLGLAVMVQVLWAMALLSAVLPAIDAAWGATGTFYFVALVATLFVPCALFFARGEPMVAEEASAGGVVNRWSACMTLLSIFALNCTVGTLWTFIERLGTEAGLDHAFINGTLGAANLVAMAGCLMLPLLMKGRGIYGWTLLMLAGCAASAGAFMLQHGAALFAGCAIGFVLTWTIGAILLFANIPRFDPVGRYATLSPAFVGFGYGIGSTVGGWLIESGRIQAAIEVAALFCVAAMALHAATRERHALAMASPAKKPA